MQVGARAEGSPSARNNPNPQAFILVKKLPYFTDFLARGLVDTVQLAGSIQSDL
jgi:hypothetical protein